MAQGGNDAACSSLPHRPVVTGMDEQGGRLARIEPAQLVLPRAEGHLREFRPKEYRPHGIVLAVGGGEEVLDGFADLVDDAEFSPEFFTNFTHYRLFRRLPGEGATAGEPVAGWCSHRRNSPRATSDDGIGSQALLVGNPSNRGAEGEDMRTGQVIIWTSDMRLHGLPLYPSTRQCGTPPTVASHPAISSSGRRPRAP